MTSADFKSIEWVWLDLDDTLWDFATNSVDSLGIIYYRHDLNRFYPTVDSWRERYLHHNHELWARYNVAEISRDYLQEQRFLRPLLEAGCPASEAKALTAILHKDYLDVLGEHSLLIDGAAELLDALHHKGFRIGILSNGFKEVQYRKLRSSGIDDKFDCVVLSDEIEVNKPDRRLFDHALAKAGTTAGKSLIIGDNPDTDIAGGAAAGWHTVYFNRDGKNSPAPGCPLTVTSLREITAMLMRL